MGAAIQTWRGTTAAAPGLTTVNPTPDVSVVLIENTGGTNALNVCFDGSASTSPGDSDQIATGESIVYTSPDDEKFSYLTLLSSGAAGQTTTYRIVAIE